MALISMEKAQKLPKMINSLKKAIINIKRSAGYITFAQYSGDAVMDESGLMLHSIMELSAKHSQKSVTL